MEVNEALALLGSYGRWQVTYFVILSMGMNFPGCWHVLAYIFQAYTPPHHCKVPEGLAVNQTIPWDRESDSYSFCLVYANASVSNDTIKCSDDVNDWDYYGDVTDTVVSDYNLVCDREYLKKLTSTINAFGILLGTIFFSPFIDYFGRRKLFLLCTWLMVVVGVWNAFTYNYYVYVVVRFLSGFIRPGYGIAAFILACELFPANQRTFAGIIIQDFWGLAIMILAVLMYFIHNWRYLQLLLSLLGLLSVPLYWFLPESIPWLMTKDRVAEAEEIIQRAARLNGITSFPDQVFDVTPLEVTPETKTTLKEEEEDAETEKMALCEKIFRKSQSTETKYTVVDLARHRRLLMFAVIMCILWFINSTVYYGITLNTGDLAGNRYLNLFLSGLVEIPAYTLAYFIVNRWGRRLPLVGFHIMAGVFLLLSQFVPDTTKSGASLLPMQITFAMLGKFGITASFGIIYLFAPELFPTTVRGQAMGVVAVTARVGSMLAPFTSSLNNIEPWLTSVVFGAVSIFGGLLTLLLPETNHRPLPQTVDDIEAWYRVPSSTLPFSADTESRSSRSDAIPKSDSSEGGRGLENGAWGWKEDKNLEGIKGLAGDCENSHPRDYLSRTEQIPIEDNATYF